MSFPSNPHQKDAEAAGTYVLAYLYPRKKYEKGASIDVIAGLARWAGHWGGLALRHNDGNV